MYNSTAHPSTIYPSTLVQTQPATTQISLADAFKPKKAGKKTSHIIIVLDNSSSMQSCRNATIDGFNEFVDSQKKDAKKTGITTYISLYKFDGYQVNLVIDRKNVKSVEKLTRSTYNPNGMTNLYDAIGGVMMEINKNLSINKKSKRDSILTCIITDGQENMSKTFDNTNIKLMIEKAENKNWGFMFLGANINAFAVGSILGFGTENTLQFETDNINESFKGASRMASSMKSAYADGVATSMAYSSSTFTDEERATAVKKKEKESK